MKRSVSAFHVPDKKIFYHDEKKLLTCAPLGGGILGKKLTLLNERPRATMSKITTKSLRGLVWIALAASSTLLGQPPFKPVTATDTRFLPISGGSGDYCYHESSAPVTYQVEITRAVGVNAAPLGPDIVDSDGYLTNPSAAIANGIVGKKATLELQVYDTDYCYVPNAVCPPRPPWQPFSDPVYVNGRWVGNLESKMNQVTQQTFPVPVEYLKFGRLNPAGGPPIKGINTIEVRPNQGPVPRGSDGRPLVGPEIRQCTLGPLSLQIEAMAPILFVHGIRSGRWWFEAVPPGATWPPFVNGFKSRNIPHKILGAPSLGDDTIRVTGENVKDEANRALTEFGVKHFHMVAHSKGGLWSRYSIARSIPGGRSVFSLTTLDTPHQGSVMADLKILAKENPQLSRWRYPVLLAADRAPYSKSMDDLTQLAVWFFNQDPRNLLPTCVEVDGEKNGVAYRAHSADANVSGNTLFGRGVIDCPAECFGFPWPIGPALYGILQGYKEVTVQGSPPVGLDIRYHQPPYPLNDFVLTVESARYLGFEDLGFNWLKNHTTIGQPDVSDYVRSSIGLALEVWLRGCQ